MESLSLIARDYSRFGIRTVSGSVRQMLAQRRSFGEFDFVYAGGLFDYLSYPVAAALTSRLFEMTRPGGIVLIPNFKPQVADAGYMEAFMDWRLIYRDHEDMRRLVESLPAHEIEDCQIFDDRDGAMTFLLLGKAA